MKAPSEASLPPALVAERERLITKPEWQPVLERLSKASIWHQLSKRPLAIAHAQLIKGWSTPARPEPPDPRWSDQDLALQIAFRSAFYFAVSGLRTWTPAEQERIVNSYRKKAKEFHEEASLWAEHFEEVAGHARALAEAYEWLASPTTDLGLVVGRRGRAPEVRAYCMMLGSRMRQLYGQALYEIVAGIATAAFDQDVTKENVRSWCK